jgi:hypothetical protein
MKFFFKFVIIIILSIGISTVGSLISDDFRGGRYSGCVLMVCVQIVATYRE